MTREEAIKLFDELPPPIAERAKRNTPPDRLHFDTTLLTKPAARAVGLAFRWVAAPEGSAFWVSVRDAAEHGLEYPSVKGLPQ